MALTRRERPILLANLLYVPAFTAVALSGRNYEFLLYVLVILVAGGLIVWKQDRVRFDPPILWGLTIWGLLHMAGGNIRVGDGVLYGVVVLPVWPAHEIVRYDHVVHCFGFGVATLVAFHLLRPCLREPIEHWGTLSFLVLMLGSGFGALNEIIEFLAVLTMPETGVGGYENTLWDLVFNFLGGVVAVVWINLRARRASA